MNKIGIGLAAIMLAILVVTCSSSADSVIKKVEKMDNQKDSLSYALGVLMGGNLQGKEIELDEATFAAAFGATVRGEDLLMNQEVANTLVQEYFQKLAEVESAEMKEEGIKFLADNSKRSEVKTTDTGLQYEVLQEGTGAQPLATDQVTVHYTGKLISGEVFDSSVERGQPATFGLNQVIPGWTEGLQLMKEGAKYRFYIPSELAYGDRGAGALIKPGSTLIFDVELIKIGG
jgi:FKBP-type peptidyl-prolyl cis-trans isomerase